MTRTVTRFVNKTRHVVKVQVGNNQHFSNLAIIKESGEYELQINANDTHREFLVAVGNGPGCIKMIVTSDDCCDFQCFTIEEVNGKVQLLRQPRHSQPTLAGSTGKASSKKPSWFRWAMWP